MKAMLLAAGRGERMGPLTANCPKPLLPVAGKPLLAHHLERLQRAGIRDVVVNAAYLSAQIERFLADFQLPGVSIRCSVETTRLETGGGIQQALPWLGAGPFLVVNSDIWSAIDYAEVMANARRCADQHPTGELHAHLVLVPNPAHNPAGDFALLDHRISNQGASRWTFAGVSVLWPALFAARQAGHFPLAPLLRQAADAQQVSGELYTGYWLDVGTPERYQIIQQYLGGEITSA